ncbi:hypothetical protein Ancab_000581 [Ancistrocladus abbreviatus]
MLYTQFLLGAISGSESFFYLAPSHLYGNIDESPSVTVLAENFVAKAITFKGRHFFKTCYIEGSVDFIFRNSQSMYEQCFINATQPGFITAQGRDAITESTGFLFPRATIYGCRDRDRNRPTDLPRKSLEAVLWSSISLIEFCWHYSPSRMECLALSRL